jgi:hypothetical protein
VSRADRQAEYWQWAKWNIMSKLSSERQLRLPSRPSPTSVCHHHEQPTHQGIVREPGSQLSRALSPEHRSRVEHLRRAEQSIELNGALSAEHYVERSTVSAASGRVDLRQGVSGRAEHRGWSIESSGTLS